MNAAIPEIPAYIGEPVLHLAEIPAEMTFAFISFAGVCAHAPFRLKTIAGVREHGLAVGSIAFETYLGHRADLSIVTIDMAQGSLEIGQTGIGRRTFVMKETAHT